MRRLEWLADPWRLALVVLLALALPLFGLGEFVSSDARARLSGTERAATDAAAARASELLGAHLASLQDEVLGAARSRDFNAAIDGVDLAELQRFLNDYKSAFSGDVERLLLALANASTTLARVPAAETDPPIADYVPATPSLGVFRVATFRVLTHATAEPGLAVSVRPPAGRASVLVAEVPLARVSDWLAPQLSAAREIRVVDEQGRLVAAASDRAPQGLARPADVASAADPDGFSSTTTVAGTLWKITALRSSAPVAAFDDAAAAQRTVRVALLAFLVAAAYVSGSFARQLRREREELRLANARLDAASEAKSRFLAAVSHDLRTPLNAILGFSDVLLQRMFGELNPKQEEYLGDIHSAGEHQLALVNDLLDLSKIEAGKMELHPVPFSVPELVESAMAIVRPLADAKHLRLSCTIAPGVGTMHQDPARLKQVLLNLLSNAIKFTTTGTVALDVSEADDRVRIAVSDTGVGIRPEDQALVFDEFRQVGASARSAQGTGLGLALVRGFARMMGGEVTLVSELGRGSTFTIVIPVR